MKSKIPKKVLRTLDGVHDTLNEIADTIDDLIDWADSIETRLQPELVPEEFTKIGEIVYLFNSMGNILAQRWMGTEKQIKKAKLLGLYRNHETAKAHRDELIAKYK